MICSQFNPGLLFTEQDSFFSTHLPIRWPGLTLTSWEASLFPLISSTDLIQLHPGVLVSTNPQNVGSLLPV